VFNFKDWVTPVENPDTVFAVSPTCGANITCFAPLDLVLVMDDSGSIDEVNGHKQFYLQLH
jgi:hypothetical protein